MTVYLSAFIFVFASVFSLTSANKLPCHELLTSVVRGVEKRDHLITDGAIFDSPNYVRLNNTHFRVCICTKVPCLRKCCPAGKAYFGKSCEPYNMDIHPGVYNDRLELMPNYRLDNFHRVYGDICTQKYVLEEPDDEYYLLHNGTLRVVNDSVDYDAADFCFENILSEDNSKSLAAVFCFNPAPVETEIAYPIGMIISIPFLLATFIIYSLPELRNLHGKNLMSEIAALLIAYTTLVTTQFATNKISYNFCVVLGFALQYTFLATFFWLNVMCFDIWSSFSGFGKLSNHIRAKERKKFILYSLYAWGIPLFISAVTIVADFAPNLPDFIIKPCVGYEKCFFSTKDAILAYFYGPAAVVFIVDIVFFILTAVKIYRVRMQTKVLTQNESNRHDEANKQRYFLYLKLFLVMGISWIMEIISWSVKGPRELWYLTDAMNALQGLFIFWIFVCNRKIKKVLMSRCCPGQLKRDSEVVTSSLKFTSTGYSDNRFALQNRKISTTSNCRV